MIKGCYVLRPLLKAKGQFGGCCLLLLIGGANKKNFYLDPWEEKVSALLDHSCLVYYNYTDKTKKMVGGLL